MKEYTDGLEYSPGLWAFSLISGHSFQFILNLSRDRNWMDQHSEHKLIKPVLQDCFEPVEDLFELNKAGFFVIGFLSHLPLVLHFSQLALSRARVLATHKTIIFFSYESPLVNSEWSCLNPRASPTVKGCVRTIHCITFCTL